ncbi:putative 2OG-Fe(II) oxygenase [Luteimonas sp. e5]
MPVSDHRERAKELMRRGQASNARELLDELIRQDGQDAELLFLRGMAHGQLSRNESAIGDFNAALAQSPDNPAILFNRALAYNALERADEALADFIRVTQLHPAASDADANAGILLLRMERPNEAVHHLRNALRRAPGNLRILRSLGNALQAAGEPEQALSALARCEQGASNDPAVLTDHAMALLANGRIDAAEARFRHALELQPRDQTAMAGLYLAACARADNDAARLLVDYSQLLAATQAPESLDLGVLREAILAHPALRWEPAGRSTRLGQQSVMLDLAPESPFFAYAELVTGFVANRIAHVRTDPVLTTHPWARSAPQRWRIQSWATVLHEGGHQSPHIHPAGWLSGVFYVDAGNACASQDGDLVFGHPPSSMQLDIAPCEHVHHPRSGQLVSFPSYFFHHTRPYHGTRPRISLAFDAIPLD